MRKWLRENAPDCGDNSCLFGGRGKGGMRTNGGCRCFKDLPTAKRIYVERLVTLTADDPMERQSAENLSLALQWQRQHDALLGFIQKRPAMLKELMEHDPRGPAPSVSSPECPSRKVCEARHSQHLEDIERLSVLSSARVEKDEFSGGTCPTCGKRS